MAKLVLTIDGLNFSDLEGFYDEIDRVLTKDLDWKTGHNLNAFNDLLRGGFGVHDYEEPFILIWKNSAKSKLELPVLDEKLRCLNSWWRLLKVMITLN